MVPLVSLTLDGAADTRRDGVDALGNHVDGSRDAVPVRASSKECLAARETGRHRICRSVDPIGRRYTNVGRLYQR